MLIKFFRNGQGGGAGPVDYLIDREVVAYDQNRNPLTDESGTIKMTRRVPEPQVIEGNPDRLRTLIDAIPYQWTYRAGVIAFTHEDVPTPDQQRDVISAFEDLAFAGLEPDQRDILWVQHRHEDRVELHFVTPRMELISGRSLNIAPPGYQKPFDALRDVLNKQHGWNDPQAPERAREVKSLVEAVHRGEAREQIHDWVIDRIENGSIQDRPTMIEALESEGFDIPRQGKAYITVRDPRSDERWRLKGEIFHEGWTRQSTVERALERSSKRADQSPSRSGSRLDALDLGKLQERLRGFIEKREAYNRERYPRASAYERAAEKERSTDLHHQPLDQSDHHRDELYRELVLGKPHDQQSPERQSLADGSHSTSNRNRNPDHLGSEDHAALTMLGERGKRSLSSSLGGPIDGDRNAYGEQLTTDPVGARLAGLRRAVGRGLRTIERNLQNTRRVASITQRLTSLIDPIRLGFEQWRELGRKLAQNLTRQRSSLEQTAEHSVTVKQQERTR
ncbi:MAG: relaxase/mobilization nuclease domain-containing protein [Hyphomicrobiales bacterium]